MPTGAITQTLDLEDQRAPHDPVTRYRARTEELLDLWATHRVRATVFVVGELAAEAPDLVRAVAAGGHELGLHGWTHTPLPDLGPERLRRDAERGKALLEDLGGRAVVGFRAPVFSLVPEARWATEILAEVGFTYSSSVLPARNPLYGDPSAPTRPFRWPSGLVELPCPVVRAGPIGLPFLGGTYLRLVPTAAVRLARAAVGDRQLLWCYLHPYDLDPDEPRWVVPEVGPTGSRLLWWNRRRMTAKLTDLMRAPVGPPLAERVDAEVQV